MDALRRFRTPLSFGSGRAIPLLSGVHQVTPGGGRIREGRGYPHGCERLHCLHGGAATLQASGRVPATSETFISPSQEYAQGYDGITVRFTVRGGTQDVLAGIGIRDSSAVASTAYPDMLSPQNFSGWTRTSAYFKGEGDVLNIGLGRGPALDIFNEAILGFEVVP